MKTAPVDYVVGDVIETISNPAYAKEGQACAILQQVNAQGVMGSGFAKAIRDRWPAVWTAYSAVIKPHQQDGGERHLGQVIWVQVEPHLYIGNIVGQRWYGRDGARYTSYDALDVAFQRVRDFVLKNGITEVHYPLIGCGLGGGDWSIVSAIINLHLDIIPHSLWIPRDLVDVPFVPR